MFEYLRKSISRQQQSRVPSKIKVSVLFRITHRRGWRVPIGNSNYSQWRNVKGRGNWDKSIFFFPHWYLFVPIYFDECWTIDDIYVYIIYILYIRSRMLKHRKHRSRSMVHLHSSRAQISRVKLTTIGRRRAPINTLSRACHQITRIHCSDFRV